MRERHIADDGARFVQRANRLPEEAIERRQHILLARGAVRDGAQPGVGELVAEAVMVRGVEQVDRHVAERRVERPAVQR